MEVSIEEAKFLLFSEGLDFAAEQMTSCYRLP